MLYLSPNFELFAKTEVLGAGQVLRARGQPLDSVLYLDSRRLPPRLTPRCCRSTMPRTRRRFASWSAPAPSCCGRSRRRSSRPATMQRTRRLRSAQREEPEVEEDLRIVEALPRRGRSQRFRVAENTMDNFMARQSAANKL